MKLTFRLRNLLSDYETSEIGFAKLETCFYRVSVKRFRDFGNFGILLGIGGLEVALEDWK
jgi:hypothetical protein